MEFKNFAANFEMGANPNHGEPIQLYRPCATELVWFIEWLWENNPGVFDSAGLHPSQPNHWLANLKGGLGETQST